MEKTEWRGIMGQVTERQLEEQHLEECIQVIKANIAAYEKDIVVMNADIKAMYESYHDNDPEIFTELSNTITMNDHMKAALAKNERALKKPYFGRIDILNETGKKEIFYLGKGGVMKDATTILIVDWRAPIANVYYENGLGSCSYLVPGNQPITIDLKRKRTYEIEQGRLVDFFDSEVVANDELLTKYLAKNKEAVLGEIIATIQKEQNDIIRKSPYRSMIVQGVAGSGKTTVAMHRISFILYNYEKDFHPEDFYIIGSNRILLNYITGVLPELDVHGVKQMTMEELFVRLLYEDWEEKKYCIAPHDDNMQRRQETAQKGTYAWFHKLEEFCVELEDAVIPQEDVWFDGQVLYAKEQIQSYVKENKTVSVQSKIDMLNTRVLAKLQNEITGRDISYTPEMRRQKVKEYTGMFGAKKWRRSIFDIYEEFLKSNHIQGCRKIKVEIIEKGMGKGKEKIRTVEKTEFDVYDLAALAYLYKRIKETDPIREAHHIVVDEAQDFGMMAYAVLKYCIPAATWTIMGDVSQNIRFGIGLNDWEDLKGLMLTDKNDTFGVLSKSYRNTVEISEFAQGILRHGTFFSYPVEPIIRHGNPVCVEKCGSEEMLLCRMAEKITAWQQDGYDTVAVVCRTVAEAEEMAKKLGSRIQIEESSLEKAEFGHGVLVLPVEYTKGLEFDAVLICNPTKEDYPEDDGHAKLLYVAATRALHELGVLHLGDMTELIEEQTF